MVTEIEEKDNQTCGNCGLYNKDWERCKLTGNQVYPDHTCGQWLTGSTCKECMIDFTKKNL